MLQIILPILGSMSISIIKKLVYTHYSNLVKKQLENRFDTHYYYFLKKNRFHTHYHYQKIIVYKF